MAVNTYYFDASDGLANQDTGFKFPAATGDANNEWSDPTNAFADDSNNATGSTNSETGEQLSVAISGNGGSSYSSFKTTSALGVTPNTYVLGGSSDLWGLSLSDTSFTNTNFRLLLKTPDAADSRQDYYNFSFGVPSGATIDGVEVEVEAGQDFSVQFVNYVKIKVYYDESGYFDPDSVWFSDANAFDGSTATAASVGHPNNGSASSNELSGVGTDAPGSGGSITQVRARAYISGEDLGGSGNAEVDASGESLGTATRAATTVADWSSYVVLSTPTGGWTWTKVGNLRVSLYASGMTNANDAVYVSRAEVEVTSEDATTSTSSTSSSVSTSSTSASTSTSISTSSTSTSITTSTSISTSTTQSHTTSTSSTSSSISTSSTSVSTSISTSVSTSSTSSSISVSTSSTSMSVSTSISTSSTSNSTSISTSSTSASISISTSSTSQSTSFSTSISTSTTVSFTTSTSSTSSSTSISTSISTSTSSTSVSVSTSSTSQSTSTSTTLIATDIHPSPFLRPPVMRHGIRITVPVGQRVRTVVPRTNLRIRR